MINLLLSKILSGISKAAKSISVSEEETWDEERRRLIKDLSISALDADLNQALDELDRKNK